MMHYDERLKHKFRLPTPRSACGWRIVISPDPNIVTFRRKPRGLRWWSPILKAFVPDSIFGRDELSPESGHP